METKICTRCKQTKPVSEFTRERKRKDGLNIHCTQCRKEHRLEARMTNKRGGAAVVLTDTRGEKPCSKCKAVKPIAEFELTAWGKAASWCLECGREYRAAYRNRPDIKQRYRMRHIKETYDLSDEEYHQLIEEQGGRCSICNKTMKKIHVDHDHNTGAVRGLLCPSCNTGLGHFDDSIEMLSRAFDYLKGGKVARSPSETST